MRTSECDLVIVGVGGQGVILISDVVGRAAVLAGRASAGPRPTAWPRGGQRHQPHPHRLQLLAAGRPGGADVLLALEPGEALRFARYLSPEGVALVNTRPVFPPTVTAGLASYPPIPKILSSLSQHCSGCWIWMPLPWPAKPAQPRP